MKTLKHWLIIMVGVFWLLPSPLLGSHLDRSYSPYDIYFKIYSSRYLPQYDYRQLIAQCRQESGPNFDTYARSPVGAVGVCQFMPLTWSDMQLQLGFVANRTNPKHNIRAAAYYMRKLLYVWRGRNRSWDERLPLGQSAYNCGTGCVLRAQRKANDKRDWEDLAPFLPTEARDYPIHIHRHYMRMRKE